VVRFQSPSRVAPKASIERGGPRKLQDVHGEDLQRGDHLLVLPVLQPRVSADLAQVARHIIGRVSVRLLAGSLQEMFCPDHAPAVILYLDSPGAKDGEEAIPQRAGGRGLCGLWWTHCKIRFNAGVTATKNYSSAAL